MRFIWATTRQVQAIRNMCYSLYNLDYVCGSLERLGKVTLYQLSIGEAKELISELMDSNIILKMCWNVLFFGIYFIGKMENTQMLWWISRHLCEYIHFLSDCSGSQRCNGKGQPARCFDLDIELQTAFP